jgi:predicted nucleotide-binding protein (sugar kinase/HSP70/actin superfamily)
MGMISPALYGILYGDLLMCLVNQVRPREIVKGSAEEMADKWTEILNRQIVGKRISYAQVKRNYQLIIDDFAKIETDDLPHVKVGIVGEIFVKFSPLGNNNLEDFLVSEGAEPVMAGVLDFVMYCAYNPILDAKLYGIGRPVAPIYRLVCSFLSKKQQDLIRIMEKDGRFTPPSSFKKTCHANEGYISSGVKMGEGWLLTAEMLELIESGVNNIVCAQPFGCLPNHIVGKGMMKPIKERHEGVNIVAIDYDPGATRINQENRIKLMLANANAALEQLEENSGIYCTAKGEA